MPAPDPYAALVAKYEHAAEVARVCAEHRRLAPSLPPIAEVAAVTLKLPIPMLRERLAAYIAEEAPDARH